MVELRYVFLFFPPSHPLFLHSHSHDDIRYRHGYLRSTSQRAQSKELLMCAPPGVCMRVFAFFTFLLRLHMFIIPFARSYPLK